MKLNKYTAISMGHAHEDCEIVCTREEARIITEALEMNGVNVGVSSYGNEATIYFRNEYQNFFGEWTREKVDDLFHRNKRFLCSLRYKEA